MTPTAAPTPEPGRAPLLSRRNVLSLGSAAAAAVTLASCSKSSTPSTEAAPSVAPSSFAAELKKPATLTFWTWVPDIKNEVALFEKKYPNIKINVVNAGQGLDEYTKLTTALKAGTGAPDVVQIEYSYIPTFTITTTCSISGRTAPTTSRATSSTGPGRRSPPVRRCGRSLRTPDRWGCSTARTSSTSTS